VTQDGDTLYLGGAFEYVGPITGGTLKNMVHIWSDGRMDEAWQPA
jgi:hypothetical protein